MPKRSKTRSGRTRTPIHPDRTASSRNLSEGSGFVRVHFGRKGSGKTWSAREIARTYKGRCYVWDPNGEYDAGDGLRVYDVREWLVAQSSTKREIASRVYVSAAQGFELLVRFVRSRGPCMLVVDELHNLAQPYSAWSGPPGRRVPHPLLELLRTTRHRRVDLLLIAQRPASVWRDVTAQADVIRCGRMEEPRDLDFLSARSGRKAAQAVARLKDTEFLELWERL